MIIFTFVTVLLFFTKKSEMTCHVVVQACKCRVWMELKKSYCFSLSLTNFQKNVCAKESDSLFFIAYLL